MMVWVNLYVVGIGYVPKAVPASAVPETVPSYASHDEAARIARNLNDGEGPEWSGDDFAAFLRRMGWSDREASRQIGIARKTVASYRAKGAPRVARFACLMREMDALAHG